LSFPPPFYRWRPHPWHGLEIGPKPPKLVNAYIEICPFDLVKYEVDKETEAIIIKHTVGARKRQAILDTASDLGLKIINPPARIEEFGEVLEEGLLEEEYELLDDEFEFDEDLDLDEDLELDEEPEEDSSS